MRFETEIPKIKVEPTSVNSINSDDTEDTVEDIELMNIRKRINEWKLKTMLPELSNRKNNKAVHEKCKLARQLSYDLASRLIGNQGDPRFTEVAQYIFGPMGNPMMWSNSFTSRVRNVISTDLYEYPMTFNTELITTFKNRKYPMFE